ncbi:MAG: hypothetical protein A2Y14_05710 [Verrucomicrobia bacterium GWF2_51_19]|nr:MAG: hypothetical protein A2Y14_05710 [Verrucomicrobia bacterium GWF2_51_19]HCJ12148.1 hypothetical protein [Opitutae bacterium]
MRKGGHYLCHTCEAKIMFIKTACTRCGAPFWGETDTRVCNVCRDQVLAFQSARSLFAYDGVGKELIHTFKYRNGRYLETDWIRLLKGQPDFLSFFTDATLVPVPLSKKKRHQRGFNQSERLAHCISKLTLAPIEPLLLKTRETPSQTQLNRQQRSQNVKNSFSLNPHMTLVPEKRYIVVDDVFTTGATLNACATTLKKAGATHISVATLAHG